MLKRFCKKNKKIIIFSIVIGLFSIFFPFTVSLVHIKKNNISIGNDNITSELKPSGKSIKIQALKQEIDIEYFIPLIVYSMMPVESETESLKTQFIITRTYLYYLMGEADSINAEEIALPYTTYDELEKKWGKNYEKNYSYTMKLLTSTYGQKIYYENELICPFYHELSAGITNDGNYPYLKSVNSESDKNSDKYTSEFVFSKKDFINKMNGLINIPDDINFVAAFNTNMEENGVYVRTITFNGQTIPAKDFANLLGLSSLAFTLNAADDSLKITCYGIGDGQGLSVQGSIDMAKNRKTCNEILSYYFTGVEVR